MPKKEAKLLVTLIRSLAKKTENHLANVRGLGLRRIHQTVEVLDTPANRGMINKVSYMLKVEEAK
jgi:large subunit ribosomal protein L30